MLAAEHYSVSFFYCDSIQVSDVSDDVRRAAVTGIGFLLFRWVVVRYLF